MSEQSSYIIKGDDPALVSQALRSTVAKLLDDRDPNISLEEMPMDCDVSAVVDACNTPAFLSDRRVVVVKDAGRFRADEVELLIDYLAAPMPSTVLVMVAGGGAMPSKLTKALKAHAHSVDASVPMGKGRQNWFAQSMKSAPVRLDRSAQDMLQNHLGDELGQLSGLLDALAVAYGEDSPVTAAELEPFLGAGGAGASWELTDAIDAGDTFAAISQLNRMLVGGHRHPLVIMATLVKHYSSLLRLDGSGVSGESEASALLGVAPYPAKKALATQRKLGSGGVSRASELVSQADIDLRGASAWPPETTLLVLVARLSKLVSSQGARVKAR